VLAIEIAIWHLQFQAPATLGSLPKRERPAELRRLFGHHIDALEAGLNEAGVQIVRKNDLVFSVTIAATPEAIERLREHIKKSHIDAVISPNDFTAHGLRGSPSR
jgi:hypothetical protein